MTDQAQGKQEWTVSGMDCAACTTKVTRAVERLPGVSDVKVALMAERLSLNLVPGTTKPETIEGTIRPPLRHVYGHRLEPVEDGTLVTADSVRSSIASFEGVPLTRLNTQAVARAVESNVAVRSASSISPGSGASSVISSASCTGPVWSHESQPVTVTRFGSARFACARASPMVCPP